jgi:hypothetical protein
MAIIAFAQSARRQSQFHCMRPKVTDGNFPAAMSAPKLAIGKMFVLSPT